MGKRKANTFQKLNLDTAVFGIHGGGNIRRNMGEVIRAMHEWAEQCNNPVELALEYAELSGELKAVLACRMCEVTRGYDPYEE